jgi:hypothetical protein
MSVRNNLWDPFAVDGIDAATVSDGGILFPDHGAFQFDAAAPAVGSADWSDIVVDIDFVDDTLTFSETAQLELNISDTPAAPQDETRTLSTPLDELSALYPGIVWPPMSEWASATNDNDPPPETSSPDDAGIGTVQNLGPAGLDWRITPPISMTIRAGFRASLRSRHRARLRRRAMMVLRRTIRQSRRCRPRAPRASTGR